MLIARIYKYILLRDNPILVEIPHNIIAEIRGRLRKVTMLVGQPLYIFYRAVHFFAIFASLRYVSWPRARLVTSMRDKDTRARA